MTSVDLDNQVYKLISSSFNKATRANAAYKNAATPIRVSKRQNVRWKIAHKRNVVGNSRYPRSSKNKKLAVRLRNIINRATTCAADSAKGFYRARDYAPNERARRVRTFKNKLSQQTGPSAYVPSQDFKAG